MTPCLFWKFDGVVRVDGGSLHRGHEGMQEITSFSHSFEQPTSPLRSATDPGAVERAQHGTFHMSMVMDESIVPMLRLMWKGKKIEKGTLRCYRRPVDSGTQRAEVPYLMIEFEDIVIAHLDLSGSTWSERPTVNFAISYAKVNYTYILTNPSTGGGGMAIPGSHDLRTNVVA